MRPRRIAAIAVSGALIAGGTGAAIAAVTRSDGQKVEDAVLADAAKRLNVTPEKLRDALAAAQDARIDQAVKDGKLTRQQADAIKARRKQSGRVLGGGPFPGPRPGGGHPGFGPGGAPRALVPGPPGPGGPVPRLGARGHGHVFGGPGVDLAKALGLTREQLGEQLRAGKSIADIAKAQGKSLSDVRTALKGAAKAKLDAAVKAGKLTQDRADKLRARINDGIDRLGTAPAFPRMRRHAAPFRPTP